MLRYLRRHWRGDYPLGFTYWVNGTLLTLPFAAAVFLAKRLVDDAAEPWHILGAFLAILLTTSALGIWQIVGTWRSARRHIRSARRNWQERRRRAAAEALPEQAAPAGPPLPPVDPPHWGAKRVFWGRAAQVMVALGAIATVVHMVPAALTGEELVKMALRRDVAADFSLRVDEDELILDGSVNFDSMRAIEESLKARPVAWLTLNSGGGRVGPAQVLRALVLDSGMNTYSEDGCLSACTLIFMGGESRVAYVGALFGFHQFSMSGVAQTEFASEHRSEIEYLVSRGVGRDFARQAYSVPPEQMWFPTLRELMSAGVVTHMHDGEHFYDFEELSFTFDLASGVETVTINDDLSFDRPPPCENPRQRTC